jgi:hypothetical protein
MDGYVEGYRTLAFRQVTDVVTFLQLVYEAVCWFLLPKFTGHYISQRLTITCFVLPHRISGRLAAVTHTNGTAQPNHRFAVSYMDSAVIHWSVRPSRACYSCFLTFFASLFFFIFPLFIYYFSPFSVFLLYIIFSVLSFFFCSFSTPYSVSRCSSVGIASRLRAWWMWYDYLQRQEIFLM